MPKLTTDQRRENWQNKVRNAVLEALDNVSPAVNVRGNKIGGGWQDKDLANLFPAIDRHAETLFDRHQLHRLDLHRTESDK